MSPLKHLTVILPLTLYWGNGQLMIVCTWLGKSDKERKKMHPLEKQHICILGLSLGFLSDLENAKEMT